MSIAIREGAGETSAILENVADEQSSDHRDCPGDPPWEAEITLLPATRPPALRERLERARASRTRRGDGPLLLLTAVALGAAALLTLGGGSSTPQRGRDAPAHEPGPPGVAAAYGYPARCLSVDIAPVNPAYARADFNHRTPCGTFAGDPTAIFHRVDGAWRPVLEAVSYACPVRSLPVSVQTELAVCPAVNR